MRSVVTARQPRSGIKVDRTEPEKCPVSFPSAQGNRAQYIVKFVLKFEKRNIANYTEELNTKEKGLKQISDKINRGFNKRSRQ